MTLTEHAPIKWNYVYSSNDGLHGSYNHRLEKLMRLAIIIPDGGGWRKQELSSSWDGRPWTQYTWA